jgi:perosamine synthetase
MQISKLAIEGGAPVREKILPYGRQTIHPDDTRAVIAALSSDWLTTGPEVAAFEADFARITRSEHAIAVNSGTAALHCAYAAAGVHRNSEVLVPALTFAATANAAVYCGGRPVFCDVDPDTLLIDPADVERKLSNATRVMAPVDYAGQPCDYDTLGAVLENRDCLIVADACHAPGAFYKGRPVGSLADASTFSFHPVKNLTTAEGGMVTTSNSALADRMRQFRNHGIAQDFRTRERKGQFLYDMQELGFNYRLSDIQCALGRSQLSRLEQNLTKRERIAMRYRKALQSVECISPLVQRDDRTHGHHLFVVRLRLEQLAVDRDQFARALRAEGIGVAVHYPPVHLHSWYRANLGTREGMCPVAEQAAQEILSLPIFPSMTDDDLADALEAVEKVANAYKR